MEVKTNEKALAMLRDLRNTGCRGSKVGAFFAERRFPYYETQVRRWHRQRDLVEMHGECVLCAVPHELNCHDYLQLLHGTQMS